MSKSVRATLLALLCLPAAAVAHSGAESAASTSHSHRANALAPVDGTLSLMHGHAPDGTSVDLGWSVDTGDQSVPLSSEPDPSLIGDPVRADDSSPATGLQGDANPIPPGPSVRPTGVATNGGRTVLVLILTASDKTTNSQTVDGARKNIFTNTNSVSAFFKQQSDGETWLTGIKRADGDVYALSLPGTMANCSAGIGSTQSADAAVKSTYGVDPVAYDHVIYVLPAGLSCGWGGMAYMPGRIVWMNNSTSVSITAHELAHNLAGAHASSLSCTQAGARVSISATCSSSEYGDPFDVLGNSGRLLSAFHRVQTGVTDAARIRTATGPGTYTLNTADAVPAAGLQTLMIPITATGASTPSYYAVELRSPLLPFDTFSLTDPVTRGVTIRKVNGFSLSNNTQLVDTTPGTTTFADAALLPGQTFADTTGGVSIRTESVASNTATIDVSMPNLAETTAPAGPSSAWAYRSGTSVIVGWGTATDEHGIDHYEVYRDGELVLETVRASYADRSLAAQGAVTYSVVAIDPSGNRGPTVATATVPAAGSTTPGQSTAPPPPSKLVGTAVGLTADLTWTAPVDAKSVTGYEVRRDGAVIATPTGARYLDATTAGTHVYEVRSTGDRGAKSAPVRVTLTLVAPPEAPADAQPPAPPSPPAPSGPQPGAGAPATSAPRVAPQPGSPTRLRLQPKVSLHRGPGGSRLATVRIPGASAISVHVGHRITRRSGSAITFAVRPNTRSVALLVTLPGAARRTIYVRIND